MTDQEARAREAAERLAETLGLTADVARADSDIDTRMEGPGEPHFL